MQLIDLDTTRTLNITRHILQGSELAGSCRFEHKFFGQISYSWSYLWFYHFDHFSSKIDNFALKIMFKSTGSGYFWTIKRYLVKSLLVQVSPQIILPLLQQKWLICPKNSAWIYMLRLILILEKVSLWCQVLYLTIEIVFCDVHINIIKKSDRK